MVMVIGLENYTRDEVKNLSTTDLYDLCNRVLWLEFIACNESFSKEEKDLASNIINLRSNCINVMKDSSELNNQILEINLNKSYEDNKNLKKDFNSLRQDFNVHICKYEGELSNSAEKDEEITYLKKQLAYKNKLLSKVSGRLHDSRSNNKDLKKKLLNTMDELRKKNIELGVCKYNYNDYVIRVDKQYHVLSKDDKVQYLQGELGRRSKLLTKSSKRLHKLRSRYKELKKINEDLASEKVNKFVGEGDTINFTYPNQDYDVKKYKLPDDITFNNFDYSPIGAPSAKERYNELYNSYCFGNTVANCYDTPFDYGNEEYEHKDPKDIVKPFLIENHLYPQCIEGCIHLKFIPDEEGEHFCTLQDGPFCPDSINSDEKHWSNRCAFYMGEDDPFPCIISLNELVNQMRKERST